MQQITAITLIGIKTTLNGIAQIMLQQSVAVGMVFAAGVFLNSPALAVLGLLGSAMGALTAALLGFDQHDNRNGLFGFNGALVGFGLGYCYGPQWLLVIFVLLGAVLSALIMQWMLRKGIRPYTFPFVVTNWSIMALNTTTGWFDIVLWSTTQADGLQIAHSIGRGFGQVLFQENMVTGFLLIAAVLFNSLVEGIFAIIASVIGVFIALLMGFPVDAINLGLFGYNGVLCAIALAGKTRTDIFSALSAVVLSVFFVWSAILVGVPA
ncbi:MAG: urea transporter, partial [Marinosulfonomonas sp.]|nr:urea transporter [Marinosulfonomonas sp.]